MILLFLRIQYKNHITLTHSKLQMFGSENRSKYQKPSCNLAANKDMSHRIDNLLLAANKDMSNRIDRITSRFTSRLLLFLVWCAFIEAAKCTNSTLSESLDVILHKHAFGALVHHRPLTGALYKAPLPVDLAGIQVAILRLRSKTLWEKGTNFSHFHIPPRTLSVPYVRRVLLVCQDLGNQSSHYYNITGYSLVSSVVGFMVYDASNFTTNNITKLNLSTTGTRISIRFPNLTFESGTNPRTNCAIFSDGKVYITERSLDNICYTTHAGHFSIVIPSSSKKTEKMRRIWVIYVVLGFIVLVACGLLGVICMKMFKLKKIHVMQRAASEGVILDTIWIHDSKMPCATVTRTHPNLENADFP